MSIHETLDARFTWFIIVPRFDVLAFSVWSYDVTVVTNLGQVLCDEHGYVDQY